MCRRFNINSRAEFMHLTLFIVNPKIFHLVNKTNTITGSRKFSGKIKSNFIRISGPMTHLWLLMFARQWKWLNPLPLLISQSILRVIKQTSVSSSGRAGHIIFIGGYLLFAQGVSTVLNYIFFVPRFAHARTIPSCLWLRLKRHFAIYLLKI